MKNQGISLISLIITIIVIIILAAIVIFSGMDTPERAQLSNFAQQVSNVNSAIVDQLTGVSTAYATTGKTRNTEQIYYTLANGFDAGQYGKMKGVGIVASGEQTPEAEADGCQNILPTFAEDKTNEKLDTSGDLTEVIPGLGLTLPKVREHNEAWYVTSDGKVFNATGFVSGGKTYFTADLYVDGELNVKAVSDTYEARAIKIAAALLKGETGAMTGVTVTNGEMD